MPSGMELQHSLIICYKNTKLFRKWYKIAHVDEHQHDTDLAFLHAGSRARSHSHSIESTTPNDSFLFR